MALKHYLWSLVAANNASADPAVNWAEGQAPSSVNDSARAMMASAAAFRDDISRAAVTGGTGAAYTLTTFQVFDSLANMDRAMIAFVPLVTNTGAVTLNVDGLGAKALRSGNLVELPAGALIGGSPYVATYFNSNSEWYVHGFFGNPYNIPLGGIIPYAGATAPNSYFAVPLGQAASRTTYATLFSLIGTTYGVGDGTTTFNLPDLGGRAIFGKEATATRLTTAGGGIDGGTLGAVGGQQNRTLLTANLPAYTPAGSVSVSSTLTDWVRGGTPDAYVGGGAGNTYQNPTKATVVSTGTLTGAAQGGTSTAVQTPPPGIVLNNIMRVL